MQKTEIWYTKSIPAEPSPTLFVFESSVSQIFPHLY